MGSTVTNQISVETKKECIEVERTEITAEQYPECSIEIDGIIGIFEDEEPS